MNTQRAFARGASRSFRGLHRCQAPLPREVARRGFYIAQTLRHEDRGARFEGELGAIEDEIRTIAR